MSWLRSALLACGAATIIGLAAALIYLQFPVSGPTSPDLPRLAVVPFTISSERAENGLIAKGLTSEVLTQLAKFKDLAVIDSTHESAVPELRARYALGADVALAGEKIRVLARVTDRADDTVLWSDRYEEDLTASKVLESNTISLRRRGPPWRREALEYTRDLAQGGGRQCRMPLRDAPPGRGCRREAALRRLRRPGRGFVRCPVLATVTPAPEKLRDPRLCPEPRILLRLPTPSPATHLILASGWLKTC